jgi:hypothetical protein
MTAKREPQVADQLALEKVIVALAEHFEADGSPCFCVTHDATYASGEVIHRPRCRLARIALDERALSEAPMTADREPQTDGGPRTI